jgi:hypothetical protein
MNLILQTNPLCCLPGQNRRIIISSLRNDTFFSNIILRFKIFNSVCIPEIIPDASFRIICFAIPDFHFYLNAIDRRFIHFSGPGIGMPYPSMKLLWTIAKGKHMIVFHAKLRQFRFLGNNFQLIQFHCSFDRLHIASVLKANCYLIPLHQIHLMYNRIDFKDRILSLAIKRVQQYFFLGNAVLQHDQHAF